MTPNGGPLASEDGVISVACGLDDVEDMHAVGPSRSGRRAEEGLAEREGSMRDLVKRREERTNLVRPAQRWSGLMRACW